MRKKKIFIVEDEKKIAGILNDYLEREDFHITILEKGDMVVSYVRQHPPDAILLDLMLPGKDGLTICREIRAFSQVPLLIVTAKVDETDRVLGLELGADDYICKPFSPREVIARIKAVMRRKKNEPTGERLVFGPVTIDTDSRKATLGEADLRLTPIEFDLLKFMISRPGCVFTRRDLVSRVKGYDCSKDGRTIDSHIKNLRKKVHELLPGNDIIQTIYGLGYSVNAPQSANIHG